jgi:hypothetical protein
MAKDEAPKLFLTIPHIPLARRLATELVDAVGDLIRAPKSYLTVALLPDSLAASLPARFVAEVGGALALGFTHPISFVKEALTPDEIGEKRRGRLTKILAVSAVFHSVLIAYILIAALLAPYAGVQIVDKKYRELELAELLKPLHYPPQLLRGPGSSETMTLEQIRERDRKRKEELERRAREKKAREEEEARKAAEAAKKAEDARKNEEAKKEAEAKAKAGAGQFGEINVAPIKDIVGKVYEMYESGQLDLAFDDFILMASFKIDPDGSIPKSSIKITKSSKSEVVDRTALEVLWRLGESHALGPLSTLSSNTIKLEINEKVARLTITSFAPTADEAKSKAQSLSFLLNILRVAQKGKNPAVAELLSHLVLKSDNKRIDADMTVPRGKATDMMKNQFGKSPPSNNNPGEK